jgi:hypothetical protein
LKKNQDFLPSKIVSVANIDLNKLKIAKISAFFVFDLFPKHVKAEV